jgi:hypothetical protein
MGQAVKIAATLSYCTTTIPNNIKTHFMGLLVEKPKRGRKGWEGFGAKANYCCFVQGYDTYKIYAQCCQKERCCWLEQSERSHHTIYTFYLHRKMQVIGLVMMPEFSSKLKMCSTLLYEEH